MRVERIGLTEWEAVLPDTGTEVFHRPEALSVLDDHFDGDLVLFGGYKGEQPIALFPAFVADRRIGRAVLSPPPGLAIPRLGPILMPTSPKQRKHEQINREFTTAVLEELFTDRSVGDRLSSVGVDGRIAATLDDVGLSPSLFRMVCNVEYGDPRPYAWDEFSLEPQFTYHLDVSDSDPDELLSSFSRSLRREIRDGEELPVTVERADTEGVRSVFLDTKERYAEQNAGFALQWDYVRDLWTALDDHARVYVAKDEDGAFRSGIIVLYSDDAAYFWLGGSRAIYDGVSINSLLHWTIIRDLIEDPPAESIDTYDLMGANTERICRYKSKFGADLVSYYIVESNGVGLSVAKRAYDLVRQIS